MQHLRLSYQNNMAIPPSYYLGKTISFYKEPVPRSVFPNNTVPRLRGQVVDAERIEDYGDYKIPNFKLTVEGASGARCNVDVVRQYVSVHETTTESE